jgi:hypothetical protein
LKEVKTGGRTGDAADSLDAMKAELRHLERTGKLGKVSTETVPLLAVTVELADHLQAPTKLREVDDSRPAQAETPVQAFVDGQPIETDVPLPVKEGDHVVRAEAVGYKPVEKRVRVIAGVPVYEQLTLEPLPAQLTVKAEAGATVIVDGRGIGELPLHAIALGAGSHVVTVVKSGRKAAAREVTLERAQSKTIDVALEPTLRRRAVSWVAIGAAGFAVVAGVAGAGAIYWDSDARDKRDLLVDGDQDTSVLADYNNSRKRRDLALSGVWVMGSAAVAVGLTAAWLYYFDSPSTEGVRVVPVASETSMGAAISRRF